MIGFLMLMWAYTPLNATSVVCYNCPDCMNAINDGYTHILLNNSIHVNGTCVDTPNSNIVIDCQNHHIMGNGSGYGIRFKGNRSSIRNCIIERFEYPVIFAPNNNGSMDNIVATNSTYGVFLNHTVGSRLYNVIAEHNTRGFDIWNASYNVLENITANDNKPYHGIWLFQYSYYNVLTNINTHHNIVGVALNKAYYNNISHLNTSYNIDGLYLLNSRYNRALHIHSHDNNNNGIILHRAGYNYISDALLEWNGIGIFIYRSNSIHNHLTDITTSHNLEAGIRIDQSANFNNITGWSSSDDETGLILYDNSMYNHIVANISHTPIGVEAWSEGNNLSISLLNVHEGVDLYYPNNITLYSSYVNKGIVLYSDGNNIKAQFDHTQFPFALKGNYCNQVVEASYMESPILWANHPDNYSGTFGEVIICSEGNYSVVSHTPVWVLYNATFNNSEAPMYVLLHNGQFFNSKGFINLTQGMCPVLSNHTLVTGEDVVINDTSLSRVGEFIGCNIDNAHLTNLSILHGALYLVNSANVHLTNVTFNQTREDLILINSSVSVRDVHLFNYLNECVVNSSSVFLNGSSVWVGPGMPSAGEYAEVLLCNESGTIRNIDVSRLVSKNSNISVFDSNVHELFVEGGRINLSRSNANVVEGQFTNALLEHSDMGRLHLKAASVHVSSSVFSDNETPVILEQCEGSMSQTTIRSNGTGLKIIRSSLINITHNYIWSNRIGLWMDCCGVGGPYVIYDNVLWADRPVYMVGGCEYDGIWNTTKAWGPNIVGGEFLGGNWYKDYSPTCDDSNHDGICDDPYYITRHGGNTDYLPLHRPMADIMVNISPCYDVVAPLHVEHMDEAVERAREGQSIYVCEGQYEANDITISHPLNIRGDRSVILTNGTAFIIEAPYVNISDLHILSQPTGLYPSGKAALKLIGVEHANIRDLVISNASVGIWLYNGANYDAFENISINAYSYGVVIDNYGSPSDHNRFNHISIEVPDSLNALGGIYIFDSSFNAFNDTTVSTSVRSLYIQSHGMASQYNIFNNTKIYGGVQMDSGYSTHFPQTIYTTSFTDSMLNDRPIMTVFNRSNAVIDASGYGWLLAYNCTNTTIINAPLTQLAYCEDTTIVDMEARNGFNGLDVWHHQGYLTIINSSVHHTSGDGIISFASSPSILNMSDVEISHIGSPNYYTLHGAGYGIKTSGHVHAKRIHLYDITSSDVQASTIQGEEWYVDSARGLHIDTTSGFNITDLHMKGTWDIHAHELYGVSTPYHWAINYSGATRVCAVISPNYVSRVVNLSSNHQVSSISERHRLCIPYSEGAFALLLKPATHDTKPQLRLSYNGGWIIVTANGEPIGNVRIYTPEIGIVGYTLSNGSINFTPPHSGEWTIYAIKQGYKEGLLIIHYEAPSSSRPNQTENHTQSTVYQTPRSNNTHQPREDQQNSPSVSPSEGAQPNGTEAQSSINGTSPPNTQPGASGISHRNSSTPTTSSSKPLPCLSLLILLPFMIGRK